MLISELEKQDLPGPYRSLRKERDPLVPRSPTILNSNRHGSRAARLRLGLARCQAEVRECERGMVEGTWPAAPTDLADRIHLIFRSHLKPDVQLISVSMQTSNMVYLYADGSK